MLENYVAVMEASRILGVRPETVKRLSREGKRTAAELGNNWIMERDRLRTFVNICDGNRERVRRSL